MHTAVTWVPRGKAVAHPQKYQLDEKELDRVAKLAKIRLEDAQLDLEAAQEEEAALDDGDEWEDEDGSANSESNDMEGIETAKRGPDDLSVYKLDDYDKEGSRAIGPIGALGNLKGLSVYKDAKDDPYITLQNDTQDDEDERAELEIYPTDNLVIAAKTDDELSQLDIYVYDDAQENLFIHHDLLLPAMPLCLEWLDFPPAAAEAREPRSHGNYVAVGTLDPDVEVWSLDVLDGMYPDAILGKSFGGEQKTAGEPPAPVKTGKKKKRPKKPVACEEHHVDSVLALSWNRSHRNLLASASADCTIKLWDLSLPTHHTALRSFELHKDKVQALQWNQNEPTILLSGSWDKTLKVFDSRAPAGAVGLQAESDIECVRWNAWRPQEFFVSFESGLVQSFDSRTLSSSPEPGAARALWTLSAHDKSVSALDHSPLVPGLMVTGGTDNVVKIWNVATYSEAHNISLLASRDLGVGKVFAAQFCPDEPSCIAVAGSKGGMQIWDTVTNPAVRRAFGDKLSTLGKDLHRERSGVVALANDVGDSESGDD